MPHNEICMLVCASVTTVCFWTPWGRAVFPMRFRDSLIWLPTVLGLLLCPSGDLVLRSSSRNLPIRSIIFF